MNVMAGWFKMHKIQENLVIDIVNSHGLAQTRLIATAIVFRKKGQSLMVLPFSCHQNLTHHMHQ